MTENASPTPPPSKLGVIRGLLAKAEASEFQAEADTLRDKAFSLMAQYGVEQAMLESFQPEGVKAVPLVRVIEVLPGAYQSQWVDFLQTLMKIMGCQNVHYTKPKKKRARRRSAWEVSQDRRRAQQAAELAREAGQELAKPVKPKAEPVVERVECLGFPSDLDRAELLWTSLCLQMFTMLLDDSGMWHMTRGEKRSFNNGRVVGFTEAVANRVRAREELAKQEAAVSEPVGVSTALVLATRADQVLAMWHERHDVDSFTSHSSSFGQRDYDGQSAGRAAGRRANIGGTGLGRASQGALGR